MSFDHALDWARNPDGTLEGHFSDQWAQGRTIFGGLVTAAGLKALRTLDPTRDPVELHTRYVAPLPPGPVSCRVEVLRAGRSLTQVEARISHPEGLAAVVSATLASPRDSAVRVVGDPRPDRPDPETLAGFPHIPGLTPIYLQHVDMRWTDGSVPFSGASEGVVGGWCRVPQTASDGFTVAAALLDTWPPPAITMLDRPAPASTIAWSAWFHDVPAEGSGWWWYREALATAASGIGVSSGALYAPDGRLAATRTQSAAVYG